MKQTLDELYMEVKTFVIETNKCSTAHIKQKFGIGFLISYQLIKRLEVDGVVSQFDDMDRVRRVLSKLEG